MSAARLRSFGERRFKGREYTEVDLFHWNPARPVLPGRVGRRVPLKAPVNNFGDLLGPAVVRRIAELRGLDLKNGSRSTRLLSIGSVLHFAHAGDTVWGSGVNGKALDAPYDVRDVDFRAVRGPLSRSFLIKHGGNVPEVYGDPGLLVSALWEREQIVKNRAWRKLTVVPNLHEWSLLRGQKDVLNPRSDMWECIAQIASSDFVVGSSLHGIIVAESFGVPARLVQSTNEPPFKYDDYFAGTGRLDYRAASSIGEAIRMGGAESPGWSSQQLLDAFPSDLWAKAD